MTSNESKDFCVSHTQYKRVKKIQQGAFMKEIFSVNSGARVAKKILCGKKKSSPGAGPSLQESNTSD